jgi:SAM-dependent methyltransferase
LYLGTFILTFARRPPLPHGWMVAALPIVVIPPMLTLIMKTNAAPQVFVPLHLAALFVAAMVCHGELVRTRPPAERLTSFYLWISTGGVAGGVFCTLLAPALFTTPLEYPFAIVLACVCRPARGDASTARRSPLDFAPMAVTMLIGVQMAVAHYAGWPPLAPRTIALIFLPAMLICVMAVPRPRAYAAGLAIVLVAGTIWQRAHTRIEHIERNFFGVQSIEMSREGQYRAFVHGTTIHGTQAMDPARRREPTTYFTRSGPAGQVLSHLTAGGARTIAVVGLGAGTLASYASPGQSWTFYEINPAVERLAKDPAYFTYLADCGAACRVVIGDARLMLARAPASGYDAIVIDAFSSDAIPIHLLTREALAVYLKALAPGGVLLLHVSNRFLDLRPVVAGLAGDAGLFALGRNDYRLGDQEAAEGKLGSAWVVVARASADLGDVATDPRWVPLPSDPAVGVWTDDFSNVFTVLRMGSGGPFRNQGTE